MHTRCASYGRERRYPPPMNRPCARVSRVSKDRCASYQNHVQTPPRIPNLPHWPTSETAIDCVARPYENVSQLNEERVFEVSARPAQRCVIIDEIKVTYPTSVRSMMIPDNKIDPSCSGGQHILRSGLLVRSAFSGHIRFMFNHLHEYRIVRQQQVDITIHTTLRPRVGYRILPAIH